MQFDLSIIQWVGITGATLYVAYRSRPWAKTILPRGKPALDAPVDMPSALADEQRWQRERAMFEKLSALSDYCVELGETKAADSLREIILPLLLRPTAEEKSPDETK